MAVQHQLLTAVSFLQRAVLLQLYGSSQEDPEVRIAAYQQLMRCPNQGLFEVVKMTLKSETSSQGVIAERVGIHLCFKPQTCMFFFFSFICSTTHLKDSYILIGPRTFLISALLLLLLL